MRLRGLWTVFLVSGAAGVVFEVAAQRLLSRVFGVSAWATSTVLATYMAGLALGAWLIGRRVDSDRAPLRLYAILELGIGLCAVALPTAVTVLGNIFAGLAHGQAPDAPWLVFGRVLISIAVLLPPAALMGGTLPALSRAVQKARPHAVPLAQLYSINLIGATLGALTTTYLWLPMGGLRHALDIGAGANLLAAVGALLLSKRLDKAAVPPQQQAATPLVPATSPSLRVLGFIAFGSGLATFAAEVTWTHLLAVVVGNSAYAFGLMLAVFLMSLWLGAQWVAAQPANALTLERLGKLWVGAAASLGLSLLLWDKAPVLFVLAGQWAHSFAAREGVRALVAVELVAIPAAFLGVVFPFVLRWLASSPSLGANVGRMTALNTLGAVVGALGAGFVLLPLLGSRGLLLALIFASAGVAAWLLGGKWRVAALSTALFAAVMPGWNVARLAAGHNVYFEETGYGAAELLWKSESVASGLTSVVRLPSGAKVLLTNGKFQGNDSGELTAQRAFAQTTMLVSHGWERALLIGVGTGCSLEALAAQPFRHVDAVELSADVLTAARTFFGAVNGGVLDSPRVSLNIADGRNWLLLTPHRYDVISIELSSVWFAGAADLYNREFYALARQRMAEGGVLQQWVQLHHLSRRDLAVILRSMKAALPHVALFYNGGQGIALASARPLTTDLNALRRLAESLQGSAATRGLPDGKLEPLLETLVLDEAQVERFIFDEARRAWLAINELESTDNNLWLEYATPKGNARGDLDAEALVSHLRRYGVAKLPSVD